jgi:hypothetical protein
MSLDCAQIDAMRSLEGDRGRRPLGSRRAVGRSSGTARGGDFVRTSGFAVPLMGADTRTTGVVRCDQPGGMDLRARGGRRVKKAPDIIVVEVLAKLAPIFE